MILLLLSIASMFSAFDGEHSVQVEHLSYQNIENNKISDIEPLRNLENIDLSKNLPPLKNLYFL